MSRDDAIRLQRFRLRAGRMEAFSDGVFAIAITLLVLEIAVPAGSALWRFAVKEDLLRPERDDADVRLLTRRLTPGLAFYMVFIMIGLFFSGGRCCRLLARRGRIDHSSATAELRCHFTLTDELKLRRHDECHPEPEALPLGQPVGEACHAGLDTDASIAGEARNRRYRYACVAARLSAGV